MNFSFKIFPILKSERLLLRELSFNDIVDIYKLRSSKEINKLITRKTPKNLDDAKAFISVCYQEFKNENRIFWAIEFDEKLVGTIVFHRISLEKNYAEIGYELNPNFHQKGIMSEAMETILEFGITNMNLKTIEAYTHQNNIASIALLEKYNFVYQPKRRCDSVEDNRIWKLEVSS